MKKANKLIVFMLAAVMAAALIPSAGVTAADDSWKPHLKDFLSNSFPSLFDYETILKNQEVYDNWNNSWGKDENGHTNYDVNTYVPESGDIPADALGEWEQINPYYPLLLPVRCNFYDLDGDGIPEVFVDYRTWYAEGVTGLVYKLYNGNYEKIATGEYLIGGYMEYDELYTNPQNKTVVIRYAPDNMGMKISFLDINDNQVIYGDYVDSAGNRYNDLWSLFYDTDADKYDELEFAKIISELTLVPEFDCSDVIDSINNPVNVVTVSPNTGDITATVALIIIAAAGIIGAILAKKFPFGYFGRIRYPRIY